MAVAEADIEQLQSALALGAKLIDVREVHEYESGHVAQAALIPLRTVPDHFDEFRDTNPVFVICLSGARSHRVCEYLAQQGIDAINVAGGMTAWADQGLPVL